MITKSYTQSKLNSVLCDAIDRIEELGTASQNSFIIFIFFRKELLTYSLLQFDFLLKNNF